MALSFKANDTTISSIIGMNKGVMMQSLKLSISLSRQQCAFIENYGLEHNIKNRSEVIKKALYLLQQQDLEQAYRAANVEINPLFDNTTLDGLSPDETW